MTPVTQKTYPLNALGVTKMLLLIILEITCVLSIKAAYDVAANFDVFPVWFAPGFGLAVSVLIAPSLYFVFQMWKMEGVSHLLSGKQSILLWIWMPLSFVCTTAVHGFYPFRLKVFSMLPWVNPVMKINDVVAAFGFVTSVVLAGVYIFTRLKTPAGIGLAIMALLILIPNDNCSNPFNYWWIDTIGASPLMYTPNLYAVLFVTCGLHGIHPKIAAFLAMGVCIGSLILGFGHRLRIIW